MTEMREEEVEYVDYDNEMVEVENESYIRGRVLVLSDSEDEDDDQYDPLVCVKPNSKPLLLTYIFYILFYMGLCLFLLM